MNAREQAEAMLAEKRQALQLGPIGRLFDPEIVDLLADALEKAKKAEAALADAAMACAAWGAGPVVDRIIRMQVSFGDRMEAKSKEIARLEAVVKEADELRGHAVGNHVFTGCALDPHVQKYDAAKAALGPR